MLTVALIGPDGSGKTSIAEQLQHSCPLPIKYLYMGVSVESSNFVLPTSRLIHYWKLRKYKRSLRKQGQAAPKRISLHDARFRIDRRSKIGATVRLLNRLAEESFRQCISWMYSMRGYVVLYDRHFLFDVCPLPSAVHQRRLTDRIHNWFLRRVYPKPGLVICLDAPPDVLYARKQEVPLDYLQTNRETLLAKSEFVEHFFRVDATQPLEEVVGIVTDLIMQHAQSGAPPHERPDAVPPGSEPQQTRPSASGQGQAVSVQPRAGRST